MSATERGIYRGQCGGWHWRERACPVCEALAPTTSEHTPSKQEHAC